MKNSAVGPERLPREVSARPIALSCIDLISIQLNIQTDIFPVAVIEILSLVSERVFFFHFHMQSSEWGNRARAQFSRLLDIT